MIITEAIRNRYWSLRIRLVDSRRLARELMPELRRSAGKKACSIGTSAFEREAYVKCRAVQLAQPLVDEIVRVHPHIPGKLANKFVLLTAMQAAADLNENERRSKKAKRPTLPASAWTLVKQPMLHVVSLAREYSSQRVALKSLLTLLIATTLVAAALGAGVILRR